MGFESLLAAVDLGSNSFRLQVGRVVDHQILPMDSLKETPRIAGGLTPDKMLDGDAQDRALTALERFGERLRGFNPDSVRAVGTNTLRVAKNSTQFLQRAEKALGFPIEIIAGREEARLIYLGVAHSLKASDANRLVVDIGGGSTEFIIGRGFKPLELESLYMGCVSYSMRFFAGGKVDKSSMKQAELAARAELETIVGELLNRGWSEAFGSSGTAKALADILQLNGYSEDGITRTGLEKLRSALIKAGTTQNAALEGLRADRIPVLPGGLAIMLAIFEALRLERMQFAEGALRLGVLYDLMGRVQHDDMRDQAARRFMRRYHVDERQAGRVCQLALRLYQQLGGVEADPYDPSQHLLEWAAWLHEVGLSVAHSGYHRHSAYIIHFADMPGFSKMDQQHLSLLVLAHRGKLVKVRGIITDPDDLALVFCLRLAVVFYRARLDIKLPEMRVKNLTRGFQINIDEVWLKGNALSEAALQDEVREWSSLDMTLRVKPLRKEQAVA